MNLFIILFVAVPLIEIFLMIKIGYMIGALNTILLIIFTAITGIYYAKLEGLNTLKSGFSQLIKNEMPIYELMSGATLAVAALLLIFPGFLTDFVGFLLIIPNTRKMLFKFITLKLNKKKISPDYIEGESEDIHDNEK